MADKKSLFEDILNESAEFEDICDAAKKGKFPIALGGVTDTVKSHIAYSLCKKLNKKLLFVTYSEANAKKLCEDCGFFFGEKICRFPDRELMFYDIEAAAGDIKKDRLTVVEKMMSSKKPHIVTTISALNSPTVSKKLYESETLKLEVGEEYDLDFISEKMVSLGYKAVDMTEGRGQFSIRGGIFDFFPLWSELAVRIEFFDTEIESIRYFDIDNQRTVENINKTKITPVTEEVLTGDARKKLAEKLDALIKKEKERKKLCEILKKDSERIKEGISFPSSDKYIPFLNSETNTFFDYVDDEYIIFFDDPKRIKEAAESNESRFFDSVSDMLEREIIPKSSFEYFRKYKDFISETEKRKMISLSPLSVHSFDFKPCYISSLTVKSLNSYSGKIALLYDAVRYYKNNKYKTIILAGGKKRGLGLSAQLEAEGIRSSFSENADVLPEDGKVIITSGSLSKGFEYPLIRCVVISDKEIFGEGKAKKRASKFNKKDAIQSFSDLSVGDYVVHQNHGIGKYVGIQRLSVGGVKRDYLKILYKGEDCLYVPTEQLKMLFKYSGGSNAVHLNKLGGVEWKKTKERVSASCADMANKLIELYAKRAHLKGIEYLADTEWQRDFEASFPYDETEDQLKSVEEIKKDMESSKPMDRLLCGDVGYGKTEVAMRAAFKAVMSGYQVAYLVPTTILASQHYSTFKQRMNGFAVNVGMLSRFVPQSAQKKVIEDLKNGTVDIVIGTHKLLNKNIKYKKLGLLIIDEEQRFGVSHKERIKEMKNEIDVLTLSATPIPRTLHMSLSGIRDMSVLATPPQDRYPVATYVLEYNEDIIKEAIEKETMRGGQVFYLYNKVEGIEKKAHELQMLLPDLKIVAAHGKMTESQLENIMMDVSEGEIDVLVCTTIIETGLDIPNVNTIIIENSERLGLSQLYQLRGRVGRSNRLAYAYLTYRKDKVLNEDAQKRLTAVKEFTEFGSGFKIAMKDLEIRGTGNVVGPQQSGNMEVVGYDMYCKILSDAVAELKGEEKQEEIECLVDLPVDAFVPESYISSHRQRIELYKKISSIETKDDMLDVYDETLDRFGDVPPEVNNLMQTSLIRFVASRKKFTEVKGSKEDLKLYFSADNPPEFDKIVEKMKIDRKLSLKNVKKPYVCYKLEKAKNDFSYLNFVFEFINNL